MVNPLLFLAKGFADRDKEVNDARAKQLEKQAEWEKQFELERYKRSLKRYDKEEAVSKQISAVAGGSGLQKATILLSLQNDPVSKAVVENITKGNITDKEKLAALSKWGEDNFNAFSDYYSSLKVPEYKSASDSTYEDFYRQALSQNAVYGKTDLKDKHKRGHRAKDLASPAEREQRVRESLEKDYGIFPTVSGIDLTGLIGEKKETKIGTVAQKISDLEAALGRELTSDEVAKIGGIATDKEEGKLHRYATTNPQSGEVSIISYTTGDEGAIAIQDTAKVGVTLPRAEKAPTQSEQKDIMGRIVSRAEKDSPLTHLRKEDTLKFISDVNSLASQMQRSGVESRAAAIERSLDVLESNVVTPEEGLRGMQPEFLGGKADVGMYISPYSKQQEADILTGGKQDRVQYTKESPATPTSNEAFNALPSGTWFVNPADGKVLRKK